MGARVAPKQPRERHAPQGENRRRGLRLASSGSLSSAAAAQTRRLGSVSRVATHRHATPRRIEKTGADRAVALAARRSHVSRQSSSETGTRLKGTENSLRRRGHGRLSELRRRRADSTSRIGLANRDAPTRHTKAHRKNRRRSCSSTLCAAVARVAPMQPTGTGRRRVELLARQPHSAPDHARQPAAS